MHLAGPGSASPPGRQRPAPEHGSYRKVLRLALLGRQRDQLFGPFQDAIAVAVELTEACGLEEADAHGHAMGQLPGVGERLTATRKGLLGMAQREQSPRPVQPSRPRVEVDVAEGERAVVGGVVQGEHLLQVPAGRSQLPR